jgi:hypothetical protein
MTALFQTRDRPAGISSAAARSNASSSSATSNARLV